VGAYVAFCVMGDRAIAAITGTMAENVGFYGVMAVTEWRRQGAGRPGRHRRAARTAAALFAEFGPAEALDSLLVRPVCMYLGPFVAGGIAGGSLLGKLAADAVFYGVAIVSSGVVQRHIAAARRTPGATGEGAAAGPTAAVPVRAVAEPGRAFVAEAGTLAATVIGTAERAGRRWVHLDVGAFNGLMESLETGNRLRFPVRDSLDAGPEPAHLTGPTCDSQDTILFDVPLSRGLAAGDLVFLESAGAYTTVYASSFNGFDVPIVRVADGDSRSGTHGPPCVG
jgi:hypothetical protein